MYGLGFKIHKPFKNREKFYWKLSCLVVKRRLYAGYVHLVFAFQMRSRLKYKQRENKVLKEILVSTTLQSHYFLHLMKSAFASRHFWCFDCQSRILHFAIWLLFFLVSLISTGVFVKMPREWIRIALWLHGLWLTSVYTFFILTEKKHT